MDGDYRSWIPPAISWREPIDMFCVSVPISDPDVVEFLADDVYRIILGPDEQIQLGAASWRRESLRCKLTEAAWHHSYLRQAGLDYAAGSELVAYCHAIFILPGARELCMILSKSPSSSLVLSQHLKAVVNEAWNKHQDALKAHAAKEEAMKADNEELAQGDPELKIKLDNMHWYFGPPSPPRPTMESFASLIPIAVSFDVGGSSYSTSRLRQQAVSCVETSGWRLPRDGSYDGMVLAAVGQKNRKTVVTWSPAAGILPSYPELRWAVQTNLPSALRQPRSSSISRPEFKPGSIEVTVGPSGITDSDLLDALDGLRLDDSRYDTRIASIREAIGVTGFEALAWYQPYHSSTEECWGIYFDAQRLDDFALSLFDDLKSQRVYLPFKVAGFLAFGLIFVHEHFHAQIEAVGSLFEISSLRPRYLRYQEKVYRATFGKKACLEEALANWSAWSWFQSEFVKNALKGIVAPNQENLVRLVVEDSLDLGPPGYRDWRCGNDSFSWRQLTMQVSTGKVIQSALSGGLPVEGLIRGTLPFDFQREDIPLRFLGSGIIASSLQTHPATLNEISKRELERALKFLGYVLDRAGGKGGHQKWTGPDQRAFIVPTRDPVSGRVFKSFLDHIGLSKSDYIETIRPNL